MNKFFYIFFLAVSTVHEISIIFEFPLNTFMTILYPILLFYFLISYVFGKLPEWVWVKAFSIIGIFSLIFILLSLFGLPKRPLEVIDAFLGLLVWVKSVNHLQKSEIYKA